MPGCHCRSPVWSCPHCVPCCCGPLSFSSSSPSNLGPPSVVVRCWGHPSSSWGRGARFCEVLGHSGSSWLGVRASPSSLNGAGSSWSPGVRQYRRRLLALVIHPTSSRSQAWGGRWVVRGGYGANWVVPRHHEALMVVFFVVGAHRHHPPVLPPCEQGLTAVGTGGGSALSALCGIVSYNPVSMGFAWVSVK